MNLVYDKKLIIKHIFVLTIALGTTYIVDQYFFKNRQLYFLAPIINIINNIF